MCAEAEVTHLVDFSLIHSVMSAIGDGRTGPFPIYNGIELAHWQTHLTSPITIPDPPTSAC